MKRIVFSVLFELQWQWVQMFPGRMLPIGRRARRLLRRAYDWSRG